MPVTSPPMSDRNIIENARTAGFTLLAVWLTCATVSVLGMALPWQAPAVPAKVENPPPIELLDIALSDFDEIATGEAAAAASAETPDLSAAQPPPPLQEMPALEEAPPLIAVAEPAPEIALPKPVAAPSRIVPRQQAESGSRANSQPATTAVASSRNGPPGGTGTAQGVQTLVFGQGEGRQPAPPYPPAAKLGGQQGTVVVRLTVGADGRVQDAETIRPCPWPSLNQSALRTIRSRWRFKSGAVRSYQIAIRFHLQ